MEDNPVRVGGGGSLTDLSFDGPDREKAFLNTLRAPNGDPVTFERAGSMGSGDTILDIYLIKASGFNGEKTVYIDMYNFSELFAPVGFSCGGRFTISEP
jgi:hypothetical protein